MIELLLTGTLTLCILETPKRVHLQTVKTQIRVKWLSGRVLDSIPRSHGFEPHRRHCVVVLEQDTFILA